MSRLVTLGEFMLRWTLPIGLRREQALPGSLEATVESVFSSLGGGSRWVNSLPENPLGKAARRALGAMGIDMSTCVSEPGGRLGQYFVEPGTEARPGVIHYDREHSALAVTPASRYHWDAVFAEADLFMFSAISPAVSAIAAELCSEAVRETGGRGIPIAFDMNYRSRLWSWSTREDPIALAKRTLLPMVRQAEVHFC